MTREEAIEVIKDIYNYTKWDTYTTNEARTMAIEALEQEPCNDAISRQAVLEFIGKQIDHSLWAFEKLVNGIKALPSVSPQTKTGHWVVHPKGVYAHLICDNCLSNAPYDCHTNYYPNCGARMESEDDNT